LAEEKTVPRLFVAIDFPASVKGQLSALCADVPDAHWVDPDKFHLTLRFIGAVEEPTAAGIAEALQRIEVPAFALTLAGVGHFREHSLWVGVEQSPSLLRLQAEIERVLQQIGLSAEPRPYVPHVKLARLRHRRGLRAFLDVHANFRAEPFEVRQFSLIESHPADRGTRYEHKADYELI
jgi:2'-5' RNA ligase